MRQRLRVLFRFCRIRFHRNAKCVRSHKIKKIRICTKKEYQFSPESKLIHFSMILKQIAFCIPITQNQRTLQTLFFRTPATQGPTQGNLKWFTLTSALEPATLPLLLYYWKDHPNWAAPLNRKICNGMKIWCRSISIVHSTIGLQRTLILRHKRSSIRDLLRRRSLRDTGRVR